MNKTIIYNGRTVPTNAYLRSELRKAGIPVYRKITKSAGRVGYVHSNRRKVSTNFISGVEAFQYSENPRITLRWSDGWKSVDHDFSIDQINNFIDQAINIAISMGFEIAGVDRINA